MKTSYRELDYESGKSIQTLRKRIDMTQTTLAEHLGVSARTIREWEAGGSYPKAQHFKEVIALAVQRRAFVPGNEASEIRVLWQVTHQKMLLDEHWLSVLLSEQQGSLPYVTEAPAEEARSLAPVITSPLSEPEEHTPPVIQNLPFPPNPFFTGRETELALMSHLFEQNARIAITQPISISGLGGIGKTQLALEYAHRGHPNIYRCVFWVNAADKATLEASYLALASLLQLPEEMEREVERIVQAVNSWLENYPHWLLILDNADDLELARSFLPTKPRGHILLTTRSQIVGSIATLIQVETLSPEEGLIFFLRRSGVWPSGTNPESIAADIRHAAGEVVEMLSGHPLALDQAGAYIEEISDPDTRATSAAFTEYRQLYQEQRRLLLKRRGALGGEHPESIALTFEISIQKACGLHPKCADALAFCSLLHPDAIPEELLHQGLSLDQLHFNEVIRALRRYSLIKRNAEKRVLSLHRLVQAVIRDGMEMKTTQRWTERVVQALNDAFPEVTFEEWKRCERYLPHALICVNAPLHKVVPPPQVEPLLTKAGTYLQERGLYADAEPLLVQALAILEQHLGASHPDTARCLNHLAHLYYRQGKYELAEPLYLRALAILEQHLEASQSPDIALCLTNLANLYDDQGKYELAEPLHRRAISIREQYLGPEHPDTAQSLNNLANLYYHQRKYELAEPLHRRALAIREQYLGPEHPDTAQSLNNLASLYGDQGKHEQAEPLYLRALAIREQHMGPEHPDTATSLNNLAITYSEQGKYELAEPLYLQALTIWEQHLGASHPTTAMGLYNLAEIYWHQGKYEQAEPLYQRALAIFEQYLGPEHSCTVEVLRGLAELYQQQGKYEQAEPLYLRVLVIHKQRLGPTHPDTQKTCEAYAAFLRLRECETSANDPVTSLTTFHSS